MPGAEAAVAIPKNVNLVAAGEDDLLASIGVEVTEHDLQCIVRRQPQRWRFEAAFLANINIRIGVVLETSSIICNNEIRPAVAGHVFTDN